MRPANVTQGRPAGRALAVVAMVVTLGISAGCKPRGQPTAPAVPHVGTDSAIMAAAPSPTPRAGTDARTTTSPVPSASPSLTATPEGASTPPAASPERQALVLRTWPLDGVGVAAVRFLAGSARLMSATGDEDGAARASRLMAEVQARAEPTNAQLTELGTIAESAAEIARDTARLDRAVVGAVTQAAVEIGVATVLERRAVEAAREARYWPLIVSSEGPRARRLLASPVPANLQAMEAIQTRLFRYLGARGIDPLPSVRAALAEL